jgi:hypothetical protein
MPRKKNRNVEGEQMAVAAVDMGDRAKMDAYEATLARRPKQDRRAYAAAGPQTRWIMEAVTQWFSFSYVNRRAFRGPSGFPGENVLHRAGLLLPRAPYHTVELLRDPPAVVVAIGKAMEELQASRVRVLIACEMHSSRGLEHAAHHLGMSPSSTRAVLKEARDALAHVLRGMGVKVPKED